MQTSFPEAPTISPLSSEPLANASLPPAKNASATPSDPAVEEVPTRVCSGCGLSEKELNQHGLFGCPRCYETFAGLVAYAVEELHGVRVPESYSQPRVTQRTITNPWPTRRGIRR